MEDPMAEPPPAALGLTTARTVLPRVALFAILIVQAPEHREYFRLLFRNFVNAAVV
jgi:hypothetical protein